MPTGALNQMIKGKNYEVAFQAFWGMGAVVYILAGSCCARYLCEVYGILLLLLTSPINTEHNENTPKKKKKSLRESTDGVAVLAPLQAWQAVCQHDDCLVVHIRLQMEVLLHQAAEMPSMKFKACLFLNYTDGLVGEPLNWRMRECIFHAASYPIHTVYFGVALIGLMHIFARRA